MWTEDQNSKRKRKDRSSLSKVSYHIRKEELKCLGISFVNKPEMKFREFDVYHGYYCGLCRKLKEHYGKFGQITLSYDMDLCIDDLN